MAATMVSSAGGLLPMLNESHPSLKLHALNNLNTFVDQFWPEISTSVTIIESLYENEEFDQHQRQLVALLVSKVVSSVKWLEDELELTALHNPESRRGNSNEKATGSQRAALSAALGGRVDVASMSTISGVKATYLLAVAFLEIIRFSNNGGILNGDTGTTLSASRSAFSCVIKYLKTPNLLPVVFQCLTAIVHRSFETAMQWLEERISEIGNDAVIIDSTLFAHACFLIKSMSLREKHIRDISVNLLTQLRNKFPQILWNSSCLDSLLFSVYNDAPSVIFDPATVTAIRSLYQKIVRECIIILLSYAPCTTQGLLQWGGAKNRKSYTQEELDEVRIEVAHYIETLL